MITRKFVNPLVGAASGRADVAIRCILFELLLARFWRFQPRNLALLMILVMSVSVATSQEVEFGAVIAGADESSESESDLVVLVVSPAAEAVPALRYRLLPTVTEQKRGSAYPFYARLTDERNDAFKQHLSKAGSDEWMDGPLAVCRSEEVKAYLRGLTRVLRQLRLASLRDRCDWEYPIGEVETLYMMLPDANQIRMFARMVALQTRSHIAEGEFPEAIESARVNLAMSKHADEGPFLVHDLIAMALVRMTLDQLQEFVSQADAPNLYWALTMLPRPMIDIGPSLDLESAMLEGTIPEITNLDEQRTPEQWKQILRKLLAAQSLEAQQPYDAPLKGRELVSYLTRSHAKARRYLMKTDEFTAEQLDGMPLQQILVLWMLEPFARQRDDQLKWEYVPWHAASKYHIESPQVDPDQSPFGKDMFDLGVGSKAVALIEQYIAALRVVEALRMHMATNDGALPMNLSEIDQVPIPKDPLSGEDFFYESDGKTAILRSKIEDRGVTRYRIRVR